MKSFVYKIKEWYLAGDYRMLLPSKRTDTQDK
jgi:hypothetical protein